MAGTIGFGMQDPVLNERRHEWYQKRNHVRIPKRAECKKYLDELYVGGDGAAEFSTIAGGFTHSLFVGQNDTASTFGLNSAAPAYGDITPDTYLGLPVYRLTGFGTSVVASFGLNGDQQLTAPAGLLASLSLRYEGVPILGQEQPYALNWQIAPNNRYSNSALGTVVAAIQAKLGQSIGVYFPDYFTPPWTGVLSIGRADAPVRTGFLRVSGANRGFGAISPWSVSGVSLYALYGNAANNKVIFSFGNTGDGFKPPSVPALDVTFEGFGTVLHMPWDAVNTEYSVVNAAAVQWLQNRSLGAKLNFIMADSV